MERELTLKVLYNHPHDQDSFILNLVHGCLQDHVDQSVAVTNVTNEFIKTEVTRQVRAVSTMRRVARSETSRIKPT